MMKRYFLPLILLVSIPSVVQPTHIAARVAVVGIVSAAIGGAEGYLAPKDRPALKDRITYVGTGLALGALVMGTAGRNPSTRAMLGMLATGTGASGLASWKIHELRHAKEVSEHHAVLKEAKDGIIDDVLKSKTD